MRFFCRRVIECSHGIQWILQYRGRTETMATSRWRGRSYCRTLEALIGCCHAHAGEIEPSASIILAELPARIIEDGRPAADLWP